MNDLINSKQLNILLSLKKLKLSLFYLSLFWSITTAISTLTTSPASAQITPDATLGNSPSKVNSQSLNNLLIEGGIKNKNNLFHWRYLQMISAFVDFKCKTITLKFD